MPNPPNPQVTALLRQVRRIADALEDPRSRAVSKEPSLAAAGRLVDYLALRDLMGRPLRAGDVQRSFPAAIDRSVNPPQLILGPLPQGAKTVAVYVDRDTVVDDISLTSHTYNAKRPVSTSYPLPHLGVGQVITRLEFRRANGYPLALGPRLAVV